MFWSKKVCSVCGNATNDPHFVIDTSVYCTSRCWDRHILSGFKKASDDLNTKIQSHLTQPLEIYQPFVSYDDRKLLPKGRFAPGYCAVCGDSLSDDTKTFAFCSSTCENKAIRPYYSSMYPGELEDQFDYQQAKKSLNDLPVMKSWELNDLHRELGFKGSKNATEILLNERVFEARVAFEQHKLDDRTKAIRAFQDVWDEERQTVLSRLHERVAQEQEREHQQEMKEYERIQRDNEKRLREQQRLDEKAAREEEQRRREQLRLDEKAAREAERIRREDQRDQDRGERLEDKRLREEEKRLKEEAERLAKEAEEKRWAPRPFKP